MFLIFDFYILLPELFILSASLFLLLFGVLVSNSFYFGFPILSLTIGKFTLYVLLVVLILTFGSPLFSVSLLNNLIIYDSLFLGIKCILLLTFFIWTLLSLEYIKKEMINVFEYWILALFSLLAMYSIIASFDILTLYLGIELQSLIFYIMASLKRTSEFSTEAGLKYFILGAFSSAILLFGFSLLYSMTGLTHFEDINKLFLAEFLEKCFILDGFFLSLLLILVSFMFKISAAPFHMWSPDVYEGAPSSITFFFALMPKIVIISLIIKLFHYNLQDVFFFWQNIFIFCAISSLFIGTLGAFVQIKWKRLLAFSSINHIGFILLGLSSGSLAGIETMFYYIFIYIFMTISLFTSFLSLRYKIYLKHNQIRYIKEIYMLGITNPALSICFVITLFSMGGIPPIAGFLAKVLIILEVVKMKLWNIAFFTILMSAIACFYYLRLIKTLYFGQLKRWPFFLPLNKNLALISSFSSISLLYFCIDPLTIQLPLKLCLLMLQI
uniref:NADH dehydrogenase subunit 2 n=1 Tax=Madagascaria erythrocladioides TaxID=753684 RepID=UPI001FCDA18D|nr:NADH dehydrogenase subunit 2 [Madagascaria erythrocladioides]UNJ18780.1 NADH dehydrogenase subunit 2 [Madagascaria erythrocladioides]